ncbi:hypothetical protein C1646_748818 [Rhizophagus diaphanus]|nr:hypothetical protein C1646_748818 [Rhizophagus diaphanus] [Rhizophagus sp. MUCL 43196]
MSLFDFKIPTITESLELSSIECHFDTWIVAKNTIKEYGKRKGFAINQHRVKYSKNQITDLGLKKTDCKWYVNLSKLKNTDFVHITFIHSDHNHELLVDNAIFAAAF